MINVILGTLPVPLSTILGISYETTSYDQRVKLRYDYIKEQLKLNPDYEGWDFIEHVGFSLDGEYNHILSTGHLISTKGRFVSLFHNKKKIISVGGRNHNGYRHSTFVIKGNKVDLRIHRVVACTFIPNHNQELGIQYLTVNHDDGVKHHNEVTNLEWMTSQANSIHAIKSKLYAEKKNTYSDSFYIGTYLLNDEYEGTRFQVNGISGLAKIGIGRSGLTEHLLGRQQFAYGCKWEKVEVSLDLPEPPTFLVEKINNDLTYLDPNCNPTMGTIIKTGEQFILYGSKEMKMYGFNPGRTNMISKEGLLPHKGCIFNRVSRLEANVIQRGLTEQQKEDILK